MSTFGKILTIFALLGSLCLLAFCVLIYMTRLNYGPVITKYKSNAESATAAEKAYKDESDKVVRENIVLKEKLLRSVPNAKPIDEQSTLIAKLEADKQLLNDKIKAMTAQIVDRDNSLKEERKRNEENSIVVNAQQLEAKQNTLDKNALKAQLDKAVKDYLDQLAIATKANVERNKYEGEAISLRERVRDVEVRAQDLVKELALAKRTGQAGNAFTPGVTTVSLSGPNPPNFAVEGKILEVKDGLVEISIGSDAGLIKGHTLDAFRLGEKKYLGVIRLITVEPNRAVGQVVGRPSIPLQRGDNVASKILGN